MKDTKETKKVVCSECGLELNEADACSFGGRTFCSDCLNVSGKCTSIYSRH